jgi:tetratricopeptide (TPR) repeat protein
MAKPFNIEWDYYLQGFRLFQRPTKAANGEAQRMFHRAIDIASDNGRRIPRAGGMLAFTQLTASLNDWISQAAGEAMLAAAKKDIRRLKDIEKRNQSALALAIKIVKSMTGKEPTEQIAIAVATYYASAAVAFDPNDFDNHWGLGRALLYKKDFEGATKSYKEATKLSSRAPHISKARLKVDCAEALFFQAPLPNEGEPVPKDVERAIELVEEAIDDAKCNAPDDAKQLRWNWALGRAHYEANNFSRSLTALLQIPNPHDLLNKSIIASYVGFGKAELAIPIARDFLWRNPEYKLDVENRWPYQDDARRDRWKAHLRVAGLPD